MYSLVSAANVVYYAFGYANNSLTFTESMVGLQGTIITVVSSAPVPSIFDDQFHHVAFSLLGTTLTFYADGRFISTHQLSGQPIPGICGAGVTGCQPDMVYIGQLTPGVSLFEGSMQTMVYYEGLLTEYDCSILAGPSHSFGFHTEPQCLCSPSYPRINTSEPGLCWDLTLTGSSPRFMTGSNHFYPTYANDNDLSTWWQAPRFSQPPDPVILTVDFQGQFQLFTANISFRSVLPGDMALEISNDGGVTWQPRQYYSSNPLCSTFSPAPVNTAPSSSTQPTCTTNGFTSPGTSTQISMVYYDAFLNGQRPGSATFINNSVLQNYLDATHIRMRMLDSWVSSSPSLSDGAYVAVAEISVDARCECNGHAATCTPPNVALNMATYQCQCQHNTSGSTCNTCPPLYNNKPWRRGIAGGATNGCKMCNCNNHAVSCHYNVSVDSFPNDQEQGGGGVCDACMHNTTGINCELCVSGMYHLPSVPITSYNTCALCSCNSQGSISIDCTDNSGTCHCKSNVQGSKCDACVSGSYSFGSSLALGCSSCNCNISGSISNVCDVVTGQCPCIGMLQGRTCNSCPTGYYVATTPINVTNNSTWQPADSVLQLTCVACDSQCVQGCSGPGPSTTVCTACRHVSLDSVCVSQCSPTTFANSVRVCDACTAQLPCIVPPLQTNFSIPETSPLGMVVGSVHTFDRDRLRNSTLVYSVEDISVPASVSLLPVPPNTKYSRGVTTNVDNTNVLVRATDLTLYNITSYTFDGLFGFVTVLQPAVQFNIPFTMATIFQQSTSISQGYLFSLSTADGVTAKYFSLFSADTFLRLFYVVSSAPYEQLSVDLGSTGVRDGQWHQILIAYDGVSTLTAYIDGLQVLNSTIGSLYVPAGTPLYVGKRSPDSLLFKGTIADFRFFPNVTLTSYPAPSYTYFAVGHSTGELTVAAPLSASLLPSHSLLVTVSDVSGQLNPLTLPVTVDLISQNVHSPVFGQASYAVTVYKNATAGTALLTLTVADADSGLNGQVSLHLNSTILNSQGVPYFSIHGRELYLNSWLDAYPQPAAYTVNVMAIDGGSPPRFSTVPVIITVINVEISPPSFMSQSSFNVNSSAAPFTPVAIIAATVRPWESINGQVLYSLAPSVSFSWAANLFSVDNTTGVVRLVTHLHAHVSLVELVVLATAVNEQHLASSQTISIHVIGDAPRIIGSGNTSFPSALSSFPALLSPVAINTSILERAGPSSYLTSIIAVDVDGSRNNQNLRYILLSGDPQGQFFVDEYSGLVTTAPVCPSISAPPSGAAVALSFASSSVHGVLDNSLGSLGSSVNARLNGGATIVNVSAPSSSSYSSYHGPSSSPPPPRAHSLRLRHLTARQKLTCLLADHR